jgi:hypothetical protein
MLNHSPVAGAAPGLIVGCAWHFSSRKRWRRDRRN